MNILVAEDNKFTALQYKNLLEKMGHSVVTTGDGEECVRKFKQAYKKTEFDSLDDHPIFGAKFDLVLLDHHMPKKTGAQAAKEILQKNPDQKIIFVTSYQKWAVEDETDEMYDKIVLLEKPFTINQLRRKIKALT